MSTRIKTDFVKNGIRDIYFNDIKPGSLISYKDEEDKIISVTVIFVANNSQYSEVLGKKREDPTLFITILQDLIRKTVMIVWDTRKKTHLIFSDLSSNPLSVIEINPP